MLNRKIIQGLCGWSDLPSSLFPHSSSSSVERLIYYSHHLGLGCVEVDSSNYAIPSSTAVKSWVDATPEGFIFHFKVFSFFCFRNIEYKSLPHNIRKELVYREGKITFHELGETLTNKLWDLMNECVAPAANANKLGCILFQFQLNFLPTSNSKEYLSYCAEKLHRDYKMAVEFRNRIWLDEDHFNETVQFLSSLRPGGVCIVAADDLEHEVYQGHTSTRGLPPNILPSRLPIIFTAKACSALAYVRIHRRQGTNRILSTEEIKEWVERIKTILQEPKIIVSNDSILTHQTEIIPNNNNINADNSTSHNTTITTNHSYQVNHSLEGSVYILWGTFHENQPIINTNNLYQALPSYCSFAWNDYVKDFMSRKKDSILSLFKTQFDKQLQDELSSSSNGTRMSSSSSSSNNNSLRASRKHNRIEALDSNSNASNCSNSEGSHDKRKDISRHDEGHVLVSSSSSLSPSRLMKRSRLTTNLAAAAAPSKKDSSHPITNYFRSEK